MIDYGFEFDPFGVTPDSRMVYLHEQFSDAWDAVQAGIFGAKGFILVTGEVGSGKTTLMRTLLAQEFENLETAVVLNTGLGPDELLRAIAEDLGVAVPEGAQRKELMDILRDRFLNTFAQGRQTAVFIDEVQHLSFESLELLRMLSNLETEVEKLVQIVLFGQEEMRQRLADPDLSQLKSRIAVYRHLKPLSEKEITGYLAHRVSIAKPEVPVSFQPAAVKRIAKASGGLPRRINILADLSLRKAASADAQDVTEAHVRAAEAEFKELDQAAVPEKKQPRSWVPTAAAWGFLIFAVAFIYVFKFGGRSTPDQLTPIVLPGPAPAPVAKVADDNQLLEEFYEYSLAKSAPGTAVPIEPAGGLRWTPVDSRIDLLRAIGLPALVRVQDANGTPLAIIQPADTAGHMMARVRTAEGTREIPWGVVIIHPESKATILLPPDAPVGTLGFGAMGEEVQRVERALAAAGVYERTPRGEYDRGVARAVRRFQEVQGLPRDGVVGPWTAGALVRSGAWELSRYPTPAGASDTSADVL